MGDHRWDDARRLEAWAGETRVNLLRAVALVVFYGYHLVNVYLIRDDPTVAGPFHTAVTGLVIAWAIETLLLYVFLTYRWFPPFLGELVVLSDLALITLLVASAGGPRTALTLLYFLVIASAPLRLSLRVVYLSTLGALAASCFSVGAYAWYTVGIERYYSDPALRIPRTVEIVFLLALTVTGLLAGQSVRQTRRLVQGHLVSATPPVRE